LYINVYVNILQNKKETTMNEVQEYILKRAMQKVASTFTPMNNTTEGLNKTASLKSASKAAWDWLARGAKGTGKLIKDNPVKAGMIGTGIIGIGSITGTGKHLQNNQEALKELQENELYGALGGTVVGAGAGAGIGALATIKASKKAKILSILLGMGAGGVAGGVGGYYAGREWGDDVRNYFAKS
jgi:hypothetical protein